jgi:hypothetical protein
MRRIIAALRLFAVRRSMLHVRTRWAALRMHRTSAHAERAHAHTHERA